MAIIGISGKIGSGKDTVGKLVQLLICKSKGVKADLTDVTDHTGTHDWWLEDSSGWEIKKFAGKLKVVASMLTGIPIEKFEDQEFKKTYLPEQWNYWTISLIDNGKLLLQHGRYNTKEEAKGFIPFLKQNYGEFRMEYTVGMQQMTVRQFLQELGTDALRNGLHPNTWVNALMTDYKPGPFFPEVPAEDHAKLPNWIITDTRFENEAQAIKDRLGIVIRVENKNITSTQSHPSETALDDWKFDYVLDNSGSIKELSDRVYDMLRHFDIISAPAAND